MDDYDKKIQQARLSEVYVENRSEQGSEYDNTVSGDFDSDDGNDNEGKETSIVEEVPCKRKIWRAVEESETGAKLDDKLRKLESLIIHKMMVKDELSVFDKDHL
jgi:hypothetical protein